MPKLTISAYGRTDGSKLNVKDLCGYKSKYWTYKVK